jgi:hypothetical protein
MDRFLHISFTFNDGLPKVQELEPVFNYMAPDWLRYSQNCWIVWTARPASDFLYGLKPLIGASDSMLIVKLDMDDRNGWQPKWVLDWMDRKRQLGPPPPPANPPSDLGNMLTALGGGALGTPYGLAGLLNPPFSKK